MTAQAGPAADVLVIFGITGDLAKKMTFQALMVQAMKPGADLTRTVDLSLLFPEELGDAPEPYERLLGDALRGDAMLFTREDGVEQTWRIVQPLLDAPPPVEPYARGSWGPAAADKLLTGHPGWREPWLA